MDPRDAALATELVYGTLRLKLRLDFILSHLLKNPEGLPGPMRLVLAMATYEILFLDKVPAYATTNWATDYVKSAINPRLAKVSNAVLRGVSRLGQDHENDDFYRQDDPGEALFLARRYACPQWLTSLWLKAYGPLDTRALLIATTNAPPLGLRFRMSVPGAKERHNELAATHLCLAASETGLALDKNPDDLKELLDSGMAVRQSFAGQQALEAIGSATWPRPMWDACCGRGGKTFLLADAAPGTILASDPNARRLRGLATESARLGTSNVAPFRTRADKFTPKRLVPAILLDAPCTGLGVLSRRPDAKHRRTLQDVTDLAAVQSRLLAHTAICLAPGGTLAYVTCTLIPEENQSRVAAFLKDHPGFTQTTEFATPVDSPLGEFFYAAVLRKS